MLHSLAAFNPQSVRYYRWNYAFEQIKELYIQKSKEEATKTNQFCEFLVSLASSCFGGGGDKEGVVGKDDGEGLEELTEEQYANLKAALGDDFSKQYPDYE